MSIGLSIRNNLMAIALVVSLALLCSQISVRVRYEFIEFMYNAEFKTLQGLALYPEFQNRILPAALLSALRWLTPDVFADRSVWFLSRFVQALAGFLVLYAVVLDFSGSRMRAVLGVVLASYAYLWTPMTHPWEFTSDFFDIMFIAVIVHLALAERAFLLLPVVVVAAFNRESAAFAGLIWMAIMATRHGVAPSQWRKFLPGVVYILIATILVYGLRHGLSQTFTPRQQIGIVHSVTNWRWLFHPTGVLPMIFAILLVFCGALARLPRPWTADQRGLLLAAVLCALPTGIFGIAAELRVWLPSLTILVILIACGRETSDRSWLFAMTRLDPGKTGAGP